MTKTGMKKAFILAALLLVCSALSACAFAPDKTQVLFESNLSPLETNGSKLVRHSAEGALSAPDVYWMYGDNFSDLIKNSHLIAVGRVSRATEKQVVFSIEGRSSRELCGEEVTMFDIEPELIIKGEADKIRVASYANITKSTLEAKTLQRYDGDQDDFAPPSGTTLFFLKSIDGELYFPINLIQGYVPLSEDDALIPQSANTAVTAGTELAELIDSVHAVLDFRDEPTTASFRAGNTNQ